MGAKTEGSEGQAVTWERIPQAEEKLNQGLKDRNVLSMVQWTQGGHVPGAVGAKGAITGDEVGGAMAGGRQITEGLADHCKNSGCFSG